MKTKRSSRSVKHRADGDASPPDTAPPAPGGAPRARRRDNLAKRLLPTLAQGILEAQKGLLQSGWQGLRAPPPTATSKLGPSASTGWGFARLEEVFDQRVSSALERIGVASPAQFAALVKRVELLERKIDASVRKRS